MPNDTPRVRMRHSASSMMDPRATSESRGDGGSGSGPIGGIRRGPWGPGLLVRLRDRQAGGEEGPEAVGVVVGAFVPRDEEDQGHDHGAPRRSLGPKRA